MTSEANRETGAQLQEFARLFRDQWADRDLGAEELVDFAARAVPNTIAAGLTLVRQDRRPTTLAASSDLAALVDAIEYEAGEGPCLEAIEEDDIIVANDLTTDERWPTFRTRALRETPIRSMMGARVLLGGDDRGAINYYAPEVDAFTQFDVGVAAMLSILSSIALRHSIEQRKVTNLEAALESSRQIGTAIGILMASQLMTADQAFDELRNASQRSHRKVRDIATYVNETGALP
jgi:hypothetical protein